MRVTLVEYESVYYYVCRLICKSAKPTIQRKCNVTYIDPQTLSPISVIYCKLLIMYTYKAFRIILPGSHHRDALVIASFPTLKEKRVEDCIKFMKNAKKDKLSYSSVTSTPHTMSYNLHSTSRDRPPPSGQN